MFSAGAIATAPRSVSAWRREIPQRPTFTFMKVVRNAGVDVTKFSTVMADHGS
jgi:hypothetical protein